MRYLHFFVIVFVLSAGLLFVGQVFAQPWPVCDGTNNGVQCSPYVPPENLCIPNGGWGCWNEIVGSGSSYTDPTDSNCIITTRQCAGGVYYGNYSGLAAGSCITDTYGNYCSAESIVGGPCSLIVVDTVWSHDRFCTGETGYVPPPPIGSPTNDPKFMFTITTIDNDVRWNEPALYQINLHNEYDGYVNFIFPDLPAGVVTSINPFANYSYDGSDPSDDDGPPIPFTITAANSVTPNLYVLTVKGVYQHPIAGELSYTQPFDFILRNDLVNNASCDVAFFNANVPDTVVAGENFPGSIRMTNTGTKPWTTVWTNPIDGQHRLGVRQPEGTTDLRWGSFAIDMMPGTVVNPGESYTFSRIFTAPTTMPSSYCTSLPGGSFSCPFTWRMIEEGVEWFPDGTSCTKNITITPPPIEPDLEVALKYPTNPTITYFTETGPSAEGTKDSPYTLSWGAVPNATSCTLDGNPVAVGGGSFDVPAPLTVSPTVHTLTCSGANGSSGSDTMTLTIPPPPTDLQASCSPSGTQITAIWSLPGAYTHSYFRESTGVNSEENMIGNPQTKIFPTTPGNTYNVWVHTRVSDANPAYSEALVKNNIVCPNPTPPTCTGAGPSGFSTNALSGFHDVYAYGVSADATAVRFGTWGVSDGQDDLYWYTGVPQGGGTWKASVDLSKHESGDPEFGTISVHAWMTNGVAPEAFCGSADFVRTDPSIPVGLHVTKNGGGRVTSDDGLINCGGGGACDANYLVPEDPLPADTVTLTAEPNSSFWLFDKWTGDECNGSTDTSCVVTMSGERNVRALFKPKPFIYREF